MMVAWSAGWVIAGYVGGVWLFFMVAWLVEVLRDAGRKDK